MNQAGLWGQETKHFHSLSPDHVLKAAELWGKRLSGRIMQLNSLENRVYDIELASPFDAPKGFSSQNVILKFYRPGRWSEQQILEEHQFLAQLTEFEVPVVAPLDFNQKTLHQDSETSLFFALFPKVQGRLKDELIKDEIDQVGRLIGRIHNIGSMQRFNSRPTLNPLMVVKNGQIEMKKIKPVEHLSFEHYLALLDQVYSILDPIFLNFKCQRLHGDFHRGNIVWTSAGPIAVDFDDCMMGPIEQDLWLLFPGTDEYSVSDRDRFIKSYLEMTRSESVKIHLAEIFRTLRMIHFNTWIAKRWEDHSFQRTFPQFLTASYWDQQLIDLRIQIGLIQELHHY